MAGRFKVDSIMDAFIWHTSEIDWCETNYEVSPHVAEFYNTISNVPFIVGSVAAMVLCWPYIPLIGWGPFMTYALLGVIGLGSMYFHATLSFAGQMLDEWAIIWIVMLCFYAYMPREYYACMGFRSERAWGLGLALFTASVTAGPYVLGPEYAVLMAPIMMMCALFPVITIVSDAFRHKQLMDNKIRALLLFAFTTFVLAVSCWVVDRLFCHHIHDWPIELHAVWHVLVYVSGHATLTYLAYMKVLVHGAEQGLEPDIHFFPRKSVPVGLPFLHLAYNRTKAM